MQYIFSLISDYTKVFVSLLQSFTVRDLFDIAIVTLIAYLVICLFRDSRAGQLVKGLILLAVFFFLSNVFKLQMVTSLLSYFFQYAFIAVLIVFQPEIRKALEQIGRSDFGSKFSSFFGGGTNEEYVKQTREAINAVCDAVQILQGLKMGALIIFERETNLNEIVETGTIINADASGQIIGNIFFNKAPLHDGAMIIRNGKVLCAGCILPLTKNDSLSASLGTRHRAGIGMSEDSDAVIVIVSEETAQISIAVNGELERDFSKDSLRRKLYSYLLPEEQDKNGVKNSVLSFIRRSKS